MIKEKIKLFMILLIIFILSLVINMGNVYASEEEYINLTSLDYDESSYADILNNKKIVINQNVKGSLISMLVNGDEREFLKGISAWANSRILYDISKYSEEYQYFTTYVGIDMSQTGTYLNNGASITVSTSVDGETWIDYLITESITAFDNSIFVNIPLDGANYLKLEAYKNGTGSGDHWYDEVVYAQPKLVKEGYEEDTSFYNEIKTVEEYDELIKKSEYAMGDEAYELLLLQRNIVNNATYSNLMAALADSQRNKEAFMWLFNDYQNLKDFTLGGAPDGSYANAINIWGQLYNDFYDDLYASGTTDLGVEYSDLYRRIMYSLSLTHSTTVGLWAGGKTGNPADPNDSDASVRFEIFKELHLAGKLDNEIFEFLEIEEMRFVMNNIIDDESIEWLNYQVTENYNGNRNPYTYITYMDGYNYSLEKYYSEENYEMWNVKYELERFGITYQTGYPKPWIVFEENGVCGAVSKTGSNINGSFGVPSSVISQPGHAAYIIYTLQDGKGFWSIWNNITGWGISGKTEKLSVRMPNGWGTGTTTGQYPASYVILAQAALNNFDNYEQSEMLLLEEKVFNEDYEKLEQIYRNSIEVCNENFDAWYGLCSLYLNDINKTETDIINLIEEITTKLVYHPLPMNDLLDRLKVNLTTGESLVQYNILLDKALNTAIVATSNDTLQDLATREVATYLMGIVDTSVATFSFDGENAGRIVLDEKYQGSNVAWDYSIDGGNTWTQTEEQSILLTDKEIESITVDEDIKIHIIGIDYSDENIFVIDIMQGQLSNTLYANDQENGVMGVTNVNEWYNEELEKWINFEDKHPNLSGIASVKVRQTATGVYQASEYTIFNFTTDIIDETNSYISIKRYSLIDFSSEHTTYVAQNIVDANANTYWHNDYSGTDTDRYITIKLEEPVYLSKIEYLPTGSSANGKIATAVIYGSLDGENFEEIARETGWANNTNLKTITINAPVLTQYIKVYAEDFYVNSSSTGKSFVVGSMLSFYEDTTISKLSPEVEIQYNIEELTNQDVSATLVNLNEEIQIEIVNNEENDTYIFKENGEFKFEYKTQDGIIWEEIAKVDWIDKISPTAKIIYDIESLTNQDVTVKLTDESEEIEITNNNGSDLYVFEENGEFTFEIEDKAGNRSEIIAKVDWIDKILPTSNIVYDIETLTNQDVTVKLTDVSEEIEITNNNGSDLYVFEENGEFTFEIEDKAGNRSEIIAKVDWIDKIAPTANIEYDINRPTSKNVIASIVDESETIVVTNNDGKDTYTFTENGVFTFKIEDLAGNESSLIAIVDWIDDSIIETEIIPTAEIEYDILTITNKNVVVKLVNASEEIEIVNNNGSDTYVFTQNGTFTFIFKNEGGIYGEVTAEVDYIDKIEPTANIEYSILEKTNKSVVVKLVNNSEDILIRNNDGKDTYTFIENGFFIFEIEDKAGNTANILATVNNIDKEIPIAQLKYDITTTTTSNVSVKLVEFSENVIITNNNGSDTYIFEENGEFTFIFEDYAGNVGKMTAKVDWIEEKQDEIYPDIEENDKEEEQEENTQENEESNQTTPGDSSNTNSNLNNSTNGDIIEEDIGEQLEAELENLEESLNEEIENSKLEENIEVVNKTFFQEPLVKIMIIILIVSLFCIIVIDFSYIKTLFVK